jgi:hypothetical protein
MARRVRWFALLALVAAFAACLAAPASEPCRCGPPRAAAEVVEPALVAAPESAPKQEAAAAAALAEAPVPAGMPDFDDPAWTRVPSRAGQYLVCWRSLAGGVPRNQDFDMEVWVLRDGAPATTASLSVNAWMPDHGHGMLRQPRAEPRGDGSFLVEGMLLHMRGHWTLLFDVLEGTLAETAEHGLDL